MTNVKVLNGIDSLYYFAESNEHYNEMYHSILKQIKLIQKSFEQQELEYENKDINIKVNDIPLSFLGKAEGFYWFKDLNEFFKIGFKDTTINQGLHDIRIQLQGVGIYTIGIQALIEFINEVLLDGYSNNHNPVTRVDLNCFVQYDFSFVIKEMFVTRKRKYSTISEIGNSTSTQTLYVGKEPFKLRLYNKHEELKKSKKKTLMYEYFANNGLDIHEPIFNVEFELHRSYLRSFDISTIQEVLSNAENLFKDSMNQIKLVDLSSLTSNAIKHNNKTRANMLPIWQYIQESYKLDEFLQTSLPLKKVKRAISIYDDTKFKHEFIALLRRAFINQLTIDIDLLEILLYQAKESLKKTKNSSSFNKQYIDVDIVHNGSVEKQRLLDDGQLIKPVNVISVNELDDYSLLTYIDKLKANEEQTQEIQDKTHVAIKEAVKRTLMTKDES